MAQVNRGLAVRALAAVAALGAVAMAAVYVRVMRGQGDRPLAWVVGVLVGAAVLAGYGSASSMYRRSALVVAGAGLTGLGVLALASIGPPILLAGMLCLAAAGLHRPATRR